MSKLIFLRHAETQKDPSINAALWGLSEKGKQQAIDIANNPLLSEVDVIYVSSEPKTLHTVDFLLKKLKLKPIQNESFDEVRRGDGFYSKDDFENEKKLQLSDLSYKAFGGESCEDALSRFKKGIDEVLGNNNQQKVLIVTHGTILNVYFAYLLNDFKDLPERWEKTKFGALGVVEKGQVVKDIV